MNRKLLRKVAREHGVSVNDVKRDMQAYIDWEYKDHRGVKPTADDIINIAVSKLRK